MFHGKYNIKHHKIEKYISKKLNFELPKLKGIVRKIKKAIDKYKLWHEHEYNFYNISKDDFSIIYNMIYNNSNESDCIYLSEKCINRAKQIDDASYYFKNNRNEHDKIVDYQILWDIIKSDLISLDILYCMEHNIIDDTILNNDIKCVYDYFKFIAEFYLEETNKYIEQYKEYINESTSKSEIQKVYKIYNKPELPKLMKY